jgi:serine/threonine protein phosphatase PrpC
MESVEGRQMNSAHSSTYDRGVPAAITDTGCERDLNEDRYAVVESPSGLAWLVCDGMGGQAGGELAAQLAVDGIRRNLEQMAPRQCVQALTAAIKEANRIILLRRQNEAFAKMGTTVVGVLFSGIEVALANVGDSRSYLIRNGSLEQLSTDHTYVQELVASGQITLEEAADHPQSHVLTRAVGSETGVMIDVSRFWIWQTPSGESDDVLLLCSDGLYSHVEDDEIAEMVSRMPAEEACSALVDLAKERPRRV